MPKPTDANWEDLANTAAIVDFFYKDKNRGKLGQGGNPTKAALNECAEYLAKTRPVVKGGEKTGLKIGTRWRVIKNLHKAILGVQTSTFLGASGWTYDNEHGFGVTDDNRAEWDNFTSQHPVFKPFSNKTSGKNISCLGHPEIPPKSWELSDWDLFDIVHEIIPATAHGKYVFNRSKKSSSSSSHVPVTGEDDDEASDKDGNGNTEGPFTQHTPSDNESFPEFIEPQDLATTTTPSTSISSIPKTPAPSKCSISDSSMKRHASDEFDSPWGSKHSKITGPEAIASLSRSVDNVGQAIRDAMPTPKQSSVLSPTKKTTTARDLARKDRDDWKITQEQYLKLHVLFGANTVAADSYMTASEDDRSDMGLLLLQMNASACRFSAGLTRFLSEFRKVVSDIFCKIVFDICFVMHKDEIVKCNKG
ncbi:hypothetical protein EV360DRAFT_76494 [Lentinula raphanica]|nr:hypothetical protein EV360DRAFT_76494 [Lentinula raphanica]